MRWRPLFVITAVALLPLLAALAPGPAAGQDERRPVAQGPPVRRPEMPRPAGDRPSGPVDPSLCSTCHASVVQHAVTHGPVSVNACNACHLVESEADHTYRLAREGTALCTFCHDMSLPNAAVVHEPLLTGECIACHDPHGGSTRALLGSANASTLCRQCHDDVTAGRSIVHGPVAAGACIVCHSAHAAPYPKLLVAEGRKLCTGCHVSVDTQLASMNNVHAPVRDDCQTCHDPHASDHGMMLLDEPQTLCLGCHESIRHMVDSANTQHAAVTTDRGCLNCHAAHASDHPSVLQNDMMSLCFECHDRAIELEDGTTLSNIKEIVSTGTSVHGPIAQSNCAACHQIHGGDNFRLLVKEYPPQFYAPFKEESYALCFSCHDRQLVQDSRTTALTNFRNGDVNLHYLHVNRDRKGRTCRACHETHASRRDKHIRDAVPFGSGGWMLPIGYERTDSGGRCTPGCHVPYQYDRLAPVSYGKPARAIWPTPGSSPTAPPGSDNGDQP